MHNIYKCTQIWTILSVLSKTKLNPNPITYLKFLELIGKVYKTKEVHSTNCDCAYCPSTTQLIICVTFVNLLKLALVTFDDLATFY